MQPKINKLKKKKGNFAGERETETETLSLNVLWLDVTTGIQFLPAVGFCVSFLKH